jgi:hypothetical protein
VSHLSHVSHVSHLSKVSQIGSGQDIKKTGTAQRTESERAGAPHLQERSVAATSCYILRAAQVQVDCVAVRRQHLCGLQHNIWIVAAELRVRKTAA